MNRYNKQGKLGTGAFGDVFKMQHKQTGEVVAVKQIKKSFKTWDECVQLRELASLKKLKKHPNIVALKEVVRDQVRIRASITHQSACSLPARRPAA
jgi:serine/threonine protein kinase